MQLDPLLGTVDLHHLQTIIRDQARGYSFTSDQTFQTARQEVHFLADPAMTHGEGLVSRQERSELVCMPFESRSHVSFRSLSKVRWTTEYRASEGDIITDFAARVGVGFDDHFVSYVSGSHDNVTFDLA